MSVVGRVAGRRRFRFRTDLGIEACRQRLAANPDSSFTTLPVADDEFTVEKTIPAWMRHLRRQTPPVVRARLTSAANGTSVAFDGRMDYAALAKRSSRPTSRAGSHSCSTHIPTLPGCDLRSGMPCQVWTFGSTASHVDWRPFETLARTCETITLPTSSGGGRGDAMAMVPGADQSERRRFARHFLEMVAAMMVGMAVVGGAAQLLCVLSDHAGVLDHAGASAPIMATSMIIGMSVWMRLRRHSWAAIADMAGAMYVQLAFLIVPFWLGVLPGGALIGLMHVLMLPAMWLVMLRRPAEYLHDHRARVGQAAQVN